MNAAVRPFNNGTPLSLVRNDLTNNYAAYACARN